MTSYKFLYLTENKYREGPISSDGLPARWDDNQICVARMIGLIWHVGGFAYGNEIGPQKLLSSDPSGQGLEII